MITKSTLLFKIKLNKILYQENLSNYHKLSKMHNLIFFYVINQYALKQLVNYWIEVELEEKLNFLVSVCFLQILKTTGGMKVVSGS